jgi:hypothetical protein
MRLALLATCTALCGAVPVARAQTAADSAAIRATALDYIEGWWTGNAERMERALHSHLAKGWCSPIRPGAAASMT